MNDGALLLIGLALVGACVGFGLYRWWQDYCARQFMEPFENVERYGE